jgi:hypothetical protein
MSYRIRGGPFSDNVDKNWVRWSVASDRGRRRRGRQKI